MVGEPVIGGKGQQRDKSEIGVLARSVILGQGDLGVKARAEKRWPASVW